MITHSSSTYNKSKNTNDSAYKLRSRKSEYQYRLTGASLHQLTQMNKRLQNERSKELYLKEDIVNEKKTAKQTNEHLMLSIDNIKEQGVYLAAKLQQELAKQEMLKTIVKHMQDQIYQEKLVKYEEVINQKQEDQYIENNILKAKQKSLQGFLVKNNSQKCKIQDKFRQIAELRSQRSVYSVLFDKLEKQYFHKQFIYKQLLIERTMLQKQMNKLIKNFQAIQSKIITKDGIDQADQLNKTFRNNFIDDRMLQKTMMKKNDHNYLISTTEREITTVRNLQVSSSLQQIQVQSCQRSIRQQQPKQKQQQLSRKKAASSYLRQSQMQLQPKSFNNLSSDVKNSGIIITASNASKVPSKKQKTLRINFDQKANSFASESNDKNQDSKRMSSVTEADDEIQRQQQFQYQKKIYLLKNDLKCSSVEEMLQAIKQFYQADSTTNKQKDVKQKKNGDNDDGDAIRLPQQHFLFTDSNYLYDDIFTKKQEIAQMQRQLHCRELNIKDRNTPKQKNLKAQLKQIIEEVQETRKSILSFKNQLFQKLHLALPNSATAAQQKGKNSNVGFEIDNKDNATFYQIYEQLKDSMAYFNDDFLQQHKQNHLLGSLKMIKHRSLNRCTSYVQQKHKNTSVVAVQRNGRPQVPLKKKSYYIRGHPSIHFNGRNKNMNQQRTKTQMNYSQHSASFSQNQSSANIESLLKQVSKSGNNQSAFPINQRHLMSILTQDQLKDQSRKILKLNKKKPMTSFSNNNQLHKYHS